MSEKIQAAIDHIDGQAEKMEMPAAQMIAQFIIEKRLTSDENADKVLANKFKDALSFIQSRAKKQAMNGVAVIEDATVYAWVDEFYQFNTAVEDKKVLDIFDLI